jgi:hypothetical protein
MPFSFCVDESARVLHVQATGEVTDEEVVDLVDRLRREVAFVTGYPILCDCSRVTAVPISSNLVVSLAMHGKMRTNFLAVIAPRPGAFGLARMYQIISDPEDVRIRVFAEAGEAKVWLSTVVGGLALHA